MRQVNKKEQISLSFSIAAAILVFIFSNISIASILFLFGISTLVLTPLLSVAISLGVLYYILRKQGIATRLIIWTQVAFVVLTVGAVILSSSTMDTTYDGNTYHKAAVGALKNGWNPVYETWGQFNKSTANPVPVNRDADIWADHYTKAHWLFGAAIYKLTGNIESAKSMLPLSILILATLAFSYIRLRLDANKSLIIAGLLACNPVALAQLFSFYNDGLIGNFVMILVITTMMLFDKKSTIGRILICTILGMGMAILINIKFTGLVYAGYYSLVYFSLLFIRYKSNKEMIKLFFITGVAALAIGVGIFGASSYVKNVYQGHHPFYPLMGRGAVDIMAANQPADFSHRHRIKKFLIANFSESDNIYRAVDRDIITKTPFTASAAEIAQFEGVDVRIGGYGVWFGGALITAMIVGVYMWLRYFKQRSYRTFLFLLTLPVVLTIMIPLIMEDAWWARYLPQLYAVPVVAILGLWLTKHKRLPYILAFMLFFNTTTLFLVQLSHQTKTRTSWVQDIRWLRKDTPITVRVPELYGIVHNLADAGIRYRHASRLMNATYEADVLNGQIIILRPNSNSPDQQNQ